MRRAARTAGWTVVTLVVLLVLLGAGITLLANTAAGRQLIEHTTARLTHGQVLLQGLSGRFPARLHLQHLVLGDPQGTWLQADDVVLTWSPLQLLERRAHIQQLTASRVALLRRPAYPSRHPHSSVSFQLPGTVQIDRFEVPRLELAAVLAGNAVALRLRGGGRYRSLQQASLQLTAQRLDQIAATYRASAQLDAQRVQVQLDLNEGADGPVANLVRLPQLGALAVHLQLAGPRNAMATVLDAHAGALQARARGTLDLPERAAMLDLTLQAPAMSPRAGLSWGSVSLRAHAQGAFTAPTSSAHLELTGLIAGAVRLDAIQADLRGQGQALALTAVLERLTLPAPVHTVLRDAPIMLQGQLRIVGTSGAVLDLNLAHPRLSAQAHYEFGSTAAGVGRDAKVGRGGSGSKLLPDTLTATLPDLAPWAALAGVDLKGRGTLQARFDPAGARADLVLSGGANISGGDARWVSLLAPRADVSVGLVFSDDRVQLERSQINAKHLQASAHGDERNGKLDVSWNVRLPDLAVLAAAAPGNLAAQGRVQGVMPHLTLTASADTAFSAHGTPGSIHVALQALNLPQRPAGRIDVSGSLDHEPLVVQARVNQAANGVLTLSIQRADWNSAQAQGALSIDGDMHAPQGQLSLRMTRLSDLDGMLGQALQGSVDAGIAFEGTGARSRARLTLDAHDVGVPAQQLTLLQLRGEVEQPLRQPRLALQLSAEAIVRGVSATLSATATGPPAALVLHATAASGGGVETASQIAAQGLWDGERRALTLASFSANYRQQTVHLLAPASISFRSGITVDRLRLGLAAAVVQIDGRLTPTLDVRASLRNLAPAALSILMPRLQGLQAQGHADADLQLQGSFSEPSGRLTFTAGGLGSASGAARSLPTGAIKMDARLAAGAADISVAIDAGAKMQLRASGRVPLRRTLPMDLKLTGHLDLSLANPILEASGQRLRGDLGVEAQLSGTLAAPQARGKLTLMSGDLQDYPRGLHVSDISATLDADGSQLRLTQLSAHAGSGTMAASGSVNLSAPGMPLQLQLTATKAQPLKSDLLTADLNMDLRLAGTLRPRDLAASGTVRVNNATINIPNALPPDVAVLQVIRPGQQAPAPSVPEKALIAKLDLTINAPTGIFLRGRGLSVQVGGTVHASGSSTAPIISGGFDLIRGTFDLAGASLTFSSGRLSFNGTGLHHKIDPTLDFTATTYTGGATATLLVGGYADAPVITLSSGSGLPQDEILARLLFGESVSQLTSLQIAGIGAALVSMTGVGGGGFNPLNTVQRALGLNRLVFSGGTASTATTTAGTTTQTNTGATVEAGRYISNRVYIGAKQSTNGPTQAQVQVDLTRQWKLQSTLSSGGGTVQGATPENDPGSSIGMSYQFEF